MREFPEIGVNLCQSVDNDAKGAKDTKDAKKVTQRRRVGARHRLAQRRREEISVFSVVFLCFLWFSFSIGVNLCQSVDKTNHRLAQIFSTKSA